ncbi:hypothetical protein GARC_3825 [Paraglaciecola arctica BSs20135]|uniref:Uncharacterized protein n=1 Tax=Paraglaciecola arctica BSs20135 TaxID=493475 RepID=K6XJE4_9ALTE|nr:hypothetical protein GARC_3825 [Paraglaciecola arctica BSs20135]
MTANEFAHIDSLNKIMKVLFIFHKQGQGQVINMHGKLSIKLTRLKG